MSIFPERWVKFSGEPIPVMTEYGYRVLDWFRFIIDQLTLPFMVLNAQILRIALPIFGIRNISLYIIRRSKEGGTYKGADRLFRDLEVIFHSAKEIKIALGEMGAGLVDHPKFLTGLRYAAEKNEATIEIVHGPRVDLNTERIYELAEEIPIDFFKMSYYPHGHFALFTSICGEVTAICEGVHDETIWARAKDKKLVVIFSGRRRLFYRVKDKFRLFENLNSEYARRKDGLSPISEHPGEKAFIQVPQDYSVRKSLKQIPKTIAQRNMRQPLTIFFDLPLDSPFNFLHDAYRDDARVNGSPAMRRDRKEIIKPESLQPPLEKTFDMISSHEELDSFAQTVSENLRTSSPLDTPDYEALYQAIHSFLEVVHTSPHADSIAFSRRTCTVAEAMIDIGILWSSRSEKNHAQEIETLYRGHAQFWSDVRPSIDSFLKILSPSEYPTTEELKVYLENKQYAHDPSILLAIAKFQR